MRWRSREAPFGAPMLMTRSTLRSSERPPDSSATFWSGLEELDLLNALEIEIGEAPHGALADPDLTTVNDDGPLVDRLEAAPFVGDRGPHRPLRRVGADLDPAARSSRGQRCRASSRCTSL